MSGRNRRGVTLVEVMASVLVLSMGLAAACAMVFYGIHLVRSSHAKALGMTTAETILADPTPLPTDPSVTPSGTTTQGYLNGLWVVRSESRPLPLDGPGGHLVAVTVTVDVYAANNSTCVASLTRRLIRQVP